jgi:hypothetical protein
VIPNGDGSMRRNIVLCGIALLMALTASAQKKKTALKVDYDKFKDITCATLIWKSKGVPADLSALHATFSQPSASQARGSSSLANSSRFDGSD